MALVHADNVKETSTTTGTGTYDLDGAVTGFQTFVAGIGTTNTCLYAVSDGTDWETGIGTVTDAATDTLARTTVLASSNSDAAVNWGAGTKTLVCTYIADRAVSRDNVITLTNKTLDDAKFDISINTQTGTSYTLALTDSSKIVEMNNASANTLTIPTNASVAFPVGTMITITQYGAGTTTVTGDTGVTVNGVSAGGGDIDARYDGVSIYKRATDEWIVQGAIGAIA
jgi:hypothetical protein